MSIFVLPYYFIGLTSHSFANFENYTDMNMNPPFQRLSESDVRVRHGSTTRHGTYAICGSKKVERKPWAHVGQSTYCEILRQM